MDPHHRNSYIRPRRPLEYLSDEDVTEEVLKRVKQWATLHGQDSFEADFAESSLWMVVKELMIREQQ